ncbi:unnamed protein product [marine sediment metagenome]|uniref:Uncharacterized protein n=1 Tax=marine sediment metagenome TaxID=412755 RepID=X0T2U8_9ZZZZ
MIPKEKIPKDVDVQIVRKLEGERNGTIGEASRHEVTCSDDSDRADTLLRKLTAIVRIIKNRFAELKRPATETLRQIRVLEADMLAPVEEAKRVLDGKKREYRAAEKRKIAEIEAKNATKRREREALEEEHAEKGHAVPGPEPVIEAPPPIEMVDVTKYRKSWEIEVTDFSKVPKKYIVINEPSTQANVRRAVSAAPKGDDKEPLIEIPGVRIYREETPVYA